MNDYPPPWRPARRELLKCAPAAFCAAIATASSKADASQPAMQFPSEGRARLAVTSYPFRELIVSPTNRGRKADLPGMDMKEFPAFVAGNFGVHNINPLLDHFSSTDEAYIDQFRKALDKAHSRIVDLGLSGKRFYAADKAVRKEAVEFGRKCVDVAVRLGSPSVRQHVSGHAGENPDVTLAASSLGELAAYGAKKNIVINLENDSLISEDPFFLVSVIEKAGNPYLRALPDFGNSLIGHDPQYNQGAVKAMLGHAFNMCHVKDMVEGSGTQVYKVELGPLFELAKASSYRGFFSMEFDTAVGGGAMEGTKRLVAESLKYLS